MSGQQVATAAEDLLGLPAGTRVGYQITQRLGYTYDGAATALRHRLVVVPPRRHGDQSVRESSLVVSAPAAEVTWQRGADGLRVAVIELARVPSRLDFDVEVTLERMVGGPRPALRATALGGRRLLASTSLTAPDAALTAAARALRAEDPLLTARRFCAWAHSHIRYVPGSTDVTTTAAQALTRGIGVCQDQAHVMLALCRAAGLPARYVSGHLVGDGPSHAWVEVIVPDGLPGRPRQAAAVGLAGLPGAVAVAFDPCHDREADLRYVTVAVGRDYTDVAPTSGRYTGTGRGLLRTTQRVSVLAVHPPDERSPKSIDDRE
ncbi:transglutaminase family protein [Candidatus Frankia nodulisporulans]|uniref:transglutaminase family protein n=1 Tax=Candidatus Frankia nodulisporulans TaxID=2060052 RepID=UPI001CDD23F8|nr:transglutaminase family protein [Candidatus Frankia nodulisporulans]